MPIPHVEGTSNDIDKIVDYFFHWLRFSLLYVIRLRRRYSRTGHGRLFDVFRRVSAAVDRRRGSFGEKIRTRAEPIYAGRIRPQQLLASGEVPFVMASGTGALTSHILGVKDQVIIMTTMNQVNSALFSRTDIKSAAELRGKTIATGRPGAFGDMMVRYVLRAKLGLVPDRDVKLLAIGEAQLAFPALERGIVQAASLTIPFTLIAKKMGYRELIDYDKAGVVYPYNTVTTLRQTPAKNPELTEKFLKTMIEGIHLAKTDKEKSLAVLKKYMKGTPDDILEETYQ